MLLQNVDTVDVAGQKHYLTTLEDVTERRRAEQSLLEANQKLSEADRRKDEYLATLSHELRNPLAPIRNSIYVLSRADAPGEARRSSV